MKKILPLFLLFFYIPFLYSQNDCTDAIIVCGNSGYSDLTVSGAGTQELTNSNSCSSEENNSVWFQLTIKTAGTLGFTLTPKNNAITEDFDFFIFGPNATCANLGTAIRCSTTNPSASNQTDNLTGMNFIETDTSEGPGPSGNSFLKALDVKVGESYFLVIDRPVGNSSFNLTWTGTASFFDAPIINPIILSNDALNLSQCDTDGVDDAMTTFNLTKNDIVLGNQTNTLLSYHKSSNDAILGSNPISNTNSYKNTRNPQTIFVRLTSSITKCFITQSFNLKVTSYTNIGTPTNLISCTSTGFNEFNLDDNSFISSDTTDQIAYFSSENDAQSNSNPLPIKYTNKTAFTTEKIWVRVTNTSGCFSLKSFDLITKPLPIVKNIVHLKQCATTSNLHTTVNLTLAEKNISTNYSNEAFKYYATKNNAINNTAEITNPITHPVNNGATIWVRTITNKNCYLISKIAITVGFTPNITYSKTMTSCDDFLDINGNNTNQNNDTDGISYFDLSDVQEEIKKTFPISNRANLDVLIFEKSTDRDAIINPIKNISKYRNKNKPAKTAQPLYIKVIDKTNNDCFGVGSFLIKVNTLPVFQLNDTALICYGKPIELKPTIAMNIYSYQWRLKGNPTILSTNYFYNTTQAGTYIFTAKNNAGCTRTRQIIVSESKKPNLNDAGVLILDDNNNHGENSYQIKIITANQYLGTDQYQFSLIDQQGVQTNFQNSPIFNNITAGLYTVVVNNKNGCLPDATLIVSVIQYPKFFTPNGDGINDIWKIKGVNSYFYRSSTTLIFDRFGKSLAIIPIDSKGWDGRHNGKELPSNDYWFKTILIDKKGKTHRRQGHFSLLR
ncbi:T9SS type B sorting domain-containing protein [Tenacibaculum finnmarkense]|uniref:Ig-like domain-containing protein n=1 Tax=Tenacibaculum finnmarkense genomovar ulcerans TaxID=2781388 RepID=A0A2I2MAQ3_9FLAO|nr:T9SS type B sorting domain-containing protein [Tenacibaculum finnmarkense]MBE7698374.1 T9SS type B sorting domain-containing protein [Tenacibaculum finnmarkense genomovar ulcerans]SOU89546.1 Protein of unknown function precursor containing a C-terminal secretion signal. Putative adhesin [Tenacibaculum finnmarkense genomovar ulcerans]